MTDAAGVSKTSVTDGWGRLSSVADATGTTDARACAAGHDPDLYAVSIRQLKQIHSATHPAHFPKPKPDAPADDAAKAELLSALVAEDEEDEEPL